MDDVIINSNYSKEELLNRLKRLFPTGNEFDLELQTLNGEYYLSKRKIVNTLPFDKGSSVFIHIIIKEQKDVGLNNSTIIVSPQTQAIYIAFATMFLLLIWILIIAISIREKRWVEKEAFIGASIITLLTLLHFRNNRIRTIQLLESRL